MNKLRIADQIDQTVHWNVLIHAKSDDQSVSLKEQNLSNCACALKQTFTSSATSEQT